jgi:hypothetical protein
MSQGIIIRDGFEEPSTMDIPVGNLKCTCGANFVVYNHRAHPEIIEEEITWLKALLEKEHSLKMPHKASYSAPLATSHG